MVTSTQEHKEIIRADYSLTAEQLDDKYNPDGDGRHPIFTNWDWIQVVAQRSTLLGYWDWVAHQVEKEEESLWRTQPC